MKILLLLVLVSCLGFSQANFLKKNLEATNSFNQTTNTTHLEGFPVNSHTVSYQITTSKFPQNRTQITNTTSIVDCQTIAETSTSTTDCETKSETIVTENGNIVQAENSNYAISSHQETKTVTTSEFFGKTQTSTSYSTVVCSTNVTQSGSSSSNCSTKIKNKTATNSTMSAVHDL